MPIGKPLCRLQLVNVGRILDTGTCVCDSILQFCYHWAVFINFCWLMPDLPFPYSQVSTDILLGYWLAPLWDIKSGSFKTGNGLRRSILSKTIRGDILSCSLMVRLSLNILEMQYTTMICSQYREQRVWLLRSTLSFLVDAYLQLLQALNNQIS